MLSCVVVTIISFEIGMLVALLKLSDSISEDSGYSITEAL